MFTYWVNRISAAATPAVPGAVWAREGGPSERKAGSWRVHFLARPRWWIYSEDQRRKRAALWVQAEDDRGGLYLDSFGGSSERAGFEELALQFRPRLDPLARALTLTFAGAREQVAVEFDR